MSPCDMQHCSVCSVCNIKVFFEKSAILSTPHVSGNNLLQINKSPLLNKTMTTGLLKVYVLEQRISKVETAIEEVAKEIDSAKYELHLLKVEALESVLPTTPWQRHQRLLEIKKTTKSLAQKLEDDKKDVLAGKTPNISFDEENGYVVVYTDGVWPYYLDKESKAGIGVWFGDRHPLNVGKPCPGPRQRNDTAEIYAAVEACKIAGENGVDKLKIYTHSMFTIKCMEKWVPRWEKMYWKEPNGKDVINRDELLELVKYSKALTDVKYVHLEGNFGPNENVAAHKLALRGASS